MTQQAPPVTAALCASVLEQAASPLAPGASTAAANSLFNVLGTSIGAARSDAVEALLTTARELAISGDVVVPGRRETVDSHWGALLAGTAAHYDDFDDTHLATVIHPGAAILATLLAMQPRSSADGAGQLAAFAIGCEAHLRLGNSISPNHYDRGWHITGTCGTFGATVTAAVLLELDAATLERALSLASLMIVGQREAFGSMSKPLHPGKAAANGIAAARLAAAGIEGFSDPLSTDHALIGLADEVDDEELERPWSGEWELEKNAFKPYPCGIVAHPLIDAAIAASEQLNGADTITSVQVLCNPLVPELMGRLHPKDGLQARFSSYHATASGLLDGHVGLPQFSDERAVSADAERLRDLIELQPNEDCHRDAAKITVRRSDGDTVVADIPHARGSLARPLTDEELFDKVDRLVEPILGAGAARDIADTVEALEQAPDLGAVLAAIRPEEGR